MDWSQKLQARLATIDNLKLYIVDNLFGYNGVSDEWTWVDMGNYYAAGAYGVSVFDNTYRLFFDTTDRNSSPRILRTEPEIKGLTFINYLQIKNIQHRANPIKIKTNPDYCSWHNDNPTTPVAFPIDFKIGGTTVGHGWY